MIDIYNSDSVQIRIANNYLIQVYNGIVSDKDWKESFQKGIEYCKSNQHITAWINDLSNFWGTNCQNIIWLHDFVNPQLINNSNGLRKIAFVEPQKSMKQANRNMDFYIEFSNIQLRECSVYINKFKKLTNAIKWVI